MNSVVHFVHRIRTCAWRNRLFALVTVCIGLWSFVIGSTALRTLRYDLTPGPETAAPSTWPEESSLLHRSGQFNLLMFAHPRCPCTAASIEQLRQILKSTRGTVNCQIVFLTPTGATSEWTASENVRKARAIPAARVIQDTGIEARRFTAATSGQVLLYDGLDRLIYSGGITLSRGHLGDCNGATVGSIVGAMTGGKNVPAHWSSRMNDTLRSEIFDYHPIPISECAKQSLEVVRALRK